MEHPNLTQAQEGLLAILIEAREKQPPSAYSDFEYSPAYTRAKGALPRSEWMQIINEGKAVLFGGKPISKIEDIPFNLDNDLVFHPSLPEIGLSVSQEDVDALTHYKLIKFRDGKIFFITPEGRAYKPGVHNQQSKIWRNWGDHPYVITASLILAAGSLIFGALPYLGATINYIKNTSPYQAVADNQTSQKNQHDEIKEGGEATVVSKALYKLKQPIVLRVINAGKNNQIEIHFLELARKYGKLVVKASVCNVSSNVFIGSNRGMGGPVRVYRGTDKEGRERFDREVKSDRESHYLSLWYTDESKRGSIKWGGLIHRSISPGQCVAYDFSEESGAALDNEALGNRSDLLKEMEGIIYAQLGEGEIVKATFPKSNLQ